MPAAVAGEQRGFVSPKPARRDRATAASNARMANLRRDSARRS
jgi:hypothetical protein